MLYPRVPSAVCFRTEQSLNITFSFKKNDKVVGSKHFIIALHNIYTAGSNMFP